MVLNLLELVLATFFRRALAPYISLRPLVSGHGFTLQPFIISLYQGLLLLWVSTHNALPWTDIMHRVMAWLSNMLREDGTSTVLWWNFYRVTRVINDEWAGYQNLMFCSHRITGISPKESRLCLRSLHENPSQTFSPNWSCQTAHPEPGGYLVKAVAVSRLTPTRTISIIHNSPLPEWQIVERLSITKHTFLAAWSWYNVVWYSFFKESQQTEKKQSIWSQLI